MLPRSRLLLAAAAAGLAALAAAAAPAGAVAKKLIEFGWDEPDPAFMRRHVAQMEATPFDGVVFHIKYRTADGSESNFTWDAWGRRRFAWEELAPAVEDLRATPFRRLKHNFLRFNTTPADLDWFDDYSTVVHNARLAARAAREGGARGIMFDPEQYRGQLFWYEKQRDAGRRSYREYSAQARRRGREVMEAFQEGYPDLVLFLTFGYSAAWRDHRRGLTPLVETRYGLLVPFLDGMVDALRGRTRLIDGHESSYPAREPWRFPAAYREIKHDVLPIVADPEKYRRVIEASFGIWMDYDWRKYGWHERETRRNYHPPRTFDLIVRKALETTDEYVWVYSETPRWWSESGRPIKLPERYVRSLVEAKAWSARRRSPARR